MATTIDGLVTGIDSAKIIEGLLSIQQRQIDSLTQKKQLALGKKTAVAGIEARMLSFRSTAATLARTQNSVFETKQVALSQEGFLSATATNKAAAGVYQLRVNSLASAHSIAAQGYADVDSAVTSGTLELRVGAGPVTTITVDSTNNTLQGVADAINDSDAGITAVIVRDGAAGSTPHRMILTSKTSGLSNEISLTNNLAATAGDATRLEFDLDNPLEAAADASVSLGSGPGAITITSDTNRIDNALGGVTLDLLKADPGQPIALTVSQDAEPATEAVQKFVDDFNGLMEYIDQQTRYDKESDTAGILLGNRAVIQLQEDVRSAVLDVVPGAGSLNRLSAIGITVTDKGRLELNSTKLTDVLSGRVAGVSPSDAIKLFSFTGDSTHPQVQFLLGSSRTKSGTTPYGVDIIQAPEQASITATSALADSIVIDGSNNTFSLNVDGAELDNLVLAAGTYTRAALAEHLQAVINSSPDLGGRSVNVGLTANALRITSEAYGATSQISSLAGTALAALGFSGSESDNGVDVAGTFIINGETETAIGRGRVLTGDSENENTADLQVRVSLTASQIVAGQEASLTVTRGVASRLDQVLGTLLDSTTGRVKQVDDRFDEEAEDIQKVIDRQKTRFDAQQESLLKQFQALETAVSQLKTTSSFLSSQLSGVNNLKSTT
ncbi:MAG: flagellar filament capping protein FliD [Planctomycetaceae bacterium]|nr:flagellar filament capping protein FliD [Planctomycetaceae bacterium]